jgi:hypothetical protein
MSQGKAPTDEYLSRVVSIYIKAFEANAPVQGAVSFVLGVPLSTAAKQIMVARNRGLLPSPQKLKAIRDYEKAERNLAKAKDDLRKATENLRKSEEK